jgi:hypothetical protein
VGAGPIGWLIIEGRLVVNWILEKVFSLCERNMLMLIIYTNVIFKGGKI